MNNNALKPELFYGLVGDSFQLMLSHFTMRLIIDSLNFAAIFEWSYYAPEINNCAGAGDVANLRRKRLLSYRNFANEICHAFKMVATVNDSKLSSHRRRYKNEHESM